jgi:hypothetical protein
MSPHGEPLRLKPGGPFLGASLLAMDHSIAAARA